MSYNPHTLAARLRRLATRLETAAQVIRAALPALPAFDGPLATLDQLVRELRHIADHIKRPLPPVH